MSYIQCIKCKKIFYSKSDDNVLCEFCGGEKFKKGDIGYIAYVWNKQLLKEQRGKQPHPDYTSQYVKDEIERKKVKKENEGNKQKILENTNKVKELTPEIVSNFDLIPINANTKNKKSRERHIDFFERNLKNSTTGKKGEEIVLQTERKYLSKLNRNDLSERVKQISINDDSAGYDILSFDENGNEKLIEVKSTILPKKNNFSFYISSNEKNIAEKSNNYYIYLVFEVNKLNPKIIKLQNPFSSGLLYLQPTQYIVKGSTK